MLYVYGIESVHYDFYNLPVDDVINGSIVHDNTVHWFGEGTNFLVVTVVHVSSAIVKISKPTYELLQFSS